jgi:Glycosyl transferases group 1
MEPFGLMMIEAMSAGTPVIAWRNGPVPEIAPPRRGLDGRGGRSRRLGHDDRSISCSALRRMPFRGRLKAGNQVAVYEDLIGKPGAPPEWAAVE